MELYKNLLKLTEESDAFFYIDQQLDDVKYRIFSYRLASYTDFCKPDALEARGIMFDVTDEENVRLVCRPFKKFFNLGENPFTIDVDYSKYQYCMEKLDGSLISTFIHKGKLQLKTKQSIFSDQAKMAMEFLEREENSFLKRYLEKLSRSDFTINLELISPSNRIVVGYDKTELRIIGIRCNITGDLIDILELIDATEELYGKGSFTDKIPFTSITEVSPAIIKEFLEEDVREMNGIEGYVVFFEDQLIKVKTDWYVSLHRSRESVDIPSRLFDCIIDEATDDLKQLFVTDKFLLEKICKMEELVIPQYNAFAKQVKEFVEQNKELGRKDYAIKGQKELHPAMFKLVMQEYLGNPLSMKEWAKKNIGLFGIREMCLDDCQN